MADESSSTKPNVFDVADWFLSKEAISPKRLQKLVYYTQAWSYALFNDYFMLDEDGNEAEFQAWAHGPVSPVLYEQYKEYRWNPIEKSAGSSVDFTRTQIDLLESVWETYGEYSANEIENLTHEEDPWINARRKSGVVAGESSNEVIAASDMEEYYSSIYTGDDL